MTCPSLSCPHRLQAPHERQVRFPRFVVYKARAVVERVEVGVRRDVQRRLDRGVRNPRLERGVAAARRTVGLHGRRRRRTTKAATATRPGRKEGRAVIALVQIWWPETAHEQRPWGGGVGVKVCAP